jgi:hypothetical protein
VSELGKVTLEKEAAGHQHDRSAGSDDVIIEPDTVVGCRVVGFGRLGRCR